MNKCLAASIVLAPLSLSPLAATASEDYFGGFSVKSHAHLIAPYEAAPLFGQRPGERPDNTISLHDIRIGYAWSRRFSVEADFARNNSLTGMNASLLPAHSRGMGLDAVGTLPIAAGLSVMGRAGVRRVVGEIDA